MSIIGVDVCDLSGVLDMMSKSIASGATVVEDFKVGSVTSCSDEVGECCHVAGDEAAFGAMSDLASLDWTSSLCGGASEMSCSLCEPTFGAVGNLLAVLLVLLMIVVAVLIGVVVGVVVMV